jgi:hypothetical protein
MATICKRQRVQERGNLMKLSRQVVKLSEMVGRGELHKAARYLYTLRPETQEMIAKALSPSMVQALAGEALNPRNLVF